MYALVTACTVHFPITAYRITARTAVSLLPHITVGGDNERIIDHIIAPHSPPLTIHCLRRATVAQVVYSSQRGLLARFTT